MDSLKTLYVTDLDGTLLNKSAAVSPRSCEILNGLIRDGMLLTYATARSLSSASLVTRGLSLSVPVITYNGAFLMNPNTKEALDFVGFRQDEVQKAKRVMDELGISPLVYAVIGGREQVSWNIFKENEGIQNYLSRRRGDKRLRPLRGEEELYEGEIFYFTCIGNREELLPLYEVFRKDPDYACHFQKELYQPEHWCEIMPAQATKEKAVRKLKQMLACDQVVAFGDSYNDIPLFQIADRCYAVENAVDELKALATGIIESNERDGVAEWLLKTRQIKGNKKNT